jgi:hypothetical protein
MIKKIESWQRGHRSWRFPLFHLCVVAIIPVMSSNDQSSSMSLVNYWTLLKHQSETFLERWIIRPLLTIRSSSPRPPISLPPEIWKIIFDYALDELFHPYQQCTWITFPTYHRDIETLAIPDITSWKNYRLVCRTFAQVLHIPIQSIISSTNSFIPEGIKTLHIQQTTILMNSTLQVLLSECRSITTLTLEQVYQDRGESVSLLMSGSKALPNVRSLRLFTGLPSNFWKRLEDSFPLLIELYTGSTPSCDTHVTLWKLEILHVRDIDQESLLHCPQLKHLFIKMRTEWDGFLQRHATHLESLLIQCHYVYRPNWWSCFPNLRTCGGAVDYSTTFWKPPSNVFPAEHLCLYYSDLNFHYHPFYTMDMVKEIYNMAPVRSITVDARLISSQEAGPLIRLCRKKGGDFTWLPPMIHPAGVPAFYFYINFYWPTRLTTAFLAPFKRYCPQWLIMVLLAPFYIILFIIFIILVLLGRAKVPFAGDMV